MEKPTLYKGKQKQREEETMAMKNQRAKDKMAVVSPYISIITLNINGLNSPIKRHRVAGWMKRQDPIICCIQEIHFRSKDTHRLRSPKYY